MRYLLLLSLIVSCAFAQAKESAGPTISKGAATVRLLEIKRVPSRGLDQAPDGLVLRFLVNRRSGGDAKFGIRETRDVVIDGTSYAEATRTALKKTFEPKTLVDSAQLFFSTHPHLAPPAQSRVDGSMVVSITLLGAPLRPEQSMEVVLHVGFGTKADDFSFATKVPPR